MNKHYYFIVSLILLTIFCSCKKENSKISNVEIIKKEFDFGEIKMDDSIIYTFSIKNISSTPLKISNVGVSCGCTSIDYPKGELSKNKVADIQVLFKPNQIGNTEKSIVVETNTDPPYHVFYLKGNVIE